MIRSGPSLQQMPKPKPKCREYDCTNSAAFSGRCLEHLFPYAHRVVFEYVRGFGGVNPTRVEQFVTRLEELGLDHDINSDVARAILETIDWHWAFDVGERREESLYDTVWSRKPPPGMPRYRRNGKRRAARKR